MPFEQISWSALNAPIPAGSLPGPVDRNSSKRIHQALAGHRKVMFAGDTPRILPKQHPVVHPQIKGDFDKWAPPRIPMEQISVLWLSFEWRP